MKSTKFFVILTFLLLFFFGTVQGVEAATYYVATNGNDSNSGTISQPWRTIGKANSTLQAGDTVQIRGGTYQETIKPSRSGNTNSRITYKNYNTDTVIISNVSMGLDLRYRSYITVHGIEFSSIDIFGRLDNAHHNHLEHCVFDQMNSYASFVGLAIRNNSSYNWIHHCSISRYGYFSSTNDFGDMLKIESNANHNLIEDNTIYYSGHAPLQVSSGYNVIRNNYLHNEAWNNGYGNRDASTSIGGTVIVGFNLIEGNRFGFTGIPSDADYSSGIQMNSPNEIIRYNAFYMTAGPGLKIETFTGAPTQSYNNHVYNNTFYKNGVITQNTRMQCSIIFIDWGVAERIYDNVVKNNIFYKVQGSNIKYHGNVKPEEQLVVNNWESGDPLFVDDESPLDPFNPNLPDFHLQANSPAIDAGMHLTVAVGSGSGTTLLVDDVYYFSDGMGIVDADWIKIGNSEPIQIKSINHTENRITLTASRSWSNGDKIWLYKNSGGRVIFKGNAPDLGAFEYSGTSPSITPTPTGKPGDGNGDGLIDGKDFIIWLTHYGQSVSGVNNGDYDGNNKIEIGDYVIWVNNFGK